jgi:hypothetical protein
MVVVVPRYVLSFSIRAPVGHMATHVPQKVHSDLSKGISFNVAGLEAKPRSM